MGIFAPRINHFETATTLSDMGPSTEGNPLACQLTKIERLCKGLKPINGMDKLEEAVFRID